jgi:hypothetical protein
MWESDEASDGASVSGILNLELWFAGWYLPRGTAASKGSGAGERKPSASWGPSMMVCRRGESGVEGRQGLVFGLWMLMLMWFGICRVEMLLLFVEPLWL